MDAQNAAELDQTKSADRGASPLTRDKHQPQDPPRPPPEKPSGHASPVKPERFAWAGGDDVSDDHDSDAETVVLPGKDGHSPSKARKVRQEDKGESDGDAASKPEGSLKLLAVADSTGDSNGNGAGRDKAATSSRSADGTAGDTASTSAIDKKRLAASTDKDRFRRNKDASSGLSSAPASPPHQHRRRRSDDGPRSSQSDSEHSQHKSSLKTSLRDKLKSGERLLPHKRKAAKVESDDEAESRKARRQRTASAGLDTPRLQREAKSYPAKPHNEYRNRSISPHPRTHRRSVSTQLPSQASNGLSQKKKRLPPPLQPTDYDTDDSSASGSPRPRSTKLRSLATPATGDSTISPAKMAPHKKHLDAHGQTLLARACAKGDYEGAKHRLTERPEDLNVADYAGNTPLQIAAINGAEDIVKLLIDAGCNLDCVNYDKDTPLLDAVDNGHLGVIKLLVDAGVNPRKANVNGEEPVDRVTDDTENAVEIRKLLMDARKRAGERRRTSEDRQSLDQDARDSHAPDSPRRSPTATAQGSGRRTATVRATKTRNDLLYMPLDEKTLRQAAGRGDEETVARILQVKEGVDDPESMVAAARGGHDLVIQLLLGLGGADPDPGPVPSLPPDFATPILAAIGQENFKVLELLLEQQQFDPTRRFRGETYYEIARRRQGTNWKDEEQLLKNSYDEFKRSRKEGVKKSPGRRDERRRREEGKEEAKAHRRNASSPTRETESRKKSFPSKMSSPREKRRSNSFGNGEEQIKRGPGRPKKEDKAATSERELSPNATHKLPKTKRAESDIAGVSSEGEAFKPRRKLVSKGELRGEREKHRRASMVSNASSLKEPSSPRESRTDDLAEKLKLSEKYHDRTKALKRDESRDRHSVSGDGSAKRHRTSLTPERPSNGEKDDEIPAKRRRLDGQGQEKRQKRPASADGPGLKSNLNREGSTKSTTRTSNKDHEDDTKDGHDRNHGRRRESGRSGTSDKSSIHVKSEDADVEMPDVAVARESDDAKSLAAREEEEEQARKKKLAEKEAAKKEEDRKAAEAQLKKDREREEAKKKEEEEAKRKKAQELEAQKKLEEETERKIREQVDRERREAEEKAFRDEEERKRRDEEERKKEREEEERKRHEEEERLRREQLEREAAEEARRKREEEERKEQERKERERLHREDIERKRAAREAEAKRLREEQERARLDKLPPLLRWLDTCPNPKSTYVADLLRRVQGVRYDTIKPAANGTEAGREQWVLNTHVALLLGEKDLSLSRYTAWSRVPATYLAKLTLWRIEWQLYSLVSRKLWDLGRQLPEYYDGQDPGEMCFEIRERLKLEAWERFRTTDMFFVKLSDLLYTVPNIAHLRDIKLDVEYRELLESDSQAMGFKTLQKWKQDPGADRFHGFAPRHKYYVGGIMVGEDVPSLAQTSKTPFPEKRVPRRGLVQVYPDDPEYARICTEQGLGHLVKTLSSPILPNGVNSLPSSQHLATPARSILNGTNGHSVFEPTGAENGANGRLLNGVHSSSA